MCSSDLSRCGMFYVNQRWLGGTLTNFDTIRKSVARLHEMEALRAPESTARLRKKEIATLDKNIIRLTKKCTGSVKRERLPSILLVVDPKKEENVVAEAKRLDIPVIALLDTNCNPDGIDFPIPGNDDALKSIKFVVEMLTDNILSGREKHLQIKPDKEKAKTEEAPEKDSKEPSEQETPKEGKSENENGKDN